MNWFTDLFWHPNPPPTLAKPTEAPVMPPATTPPPAPKDLPAVSAVAPPTGSLAITLDQLCRHWPHGDSSVPGLVEGIAASSAAVFAKYGITTKLEVAMMFGQFSEETGGGIDMVEDIRYTPARALQLWPSHFAGTVGSVYARTGSFVGDPQFDIKLMDLVYGSRMGNRPGTHDGSTYIGRSLSQITGRGQSTAPASGYIGVAEKTGIDVIGNPALAIAPANALEVSVADFILCGCLPFAKAGDVLNTTKRLNGGTNGLAERQSWTAIWRREFGV